MERKFNLISDQNTQSIDKLKTQLSNLVAITIRDNDEIKWSEQELASSKESCKQLEGDIQKLIIGRNTEIADLNETIVFLQNKIKASEALNESLRDEIICINSLNSNKFKQCASPLESHILNSSKCEGNNREESNISSCLHPYDQLSCEAVYQTRIAEPVDRQTTPHTSRSNNESFDSDVIITANNDTLKSNQVIAPSTSKSPYIREIPRPVGKTVSALSLTPATKRKRTLPEDCVMTPNVHVTQRPDPVNSLIMNNLDHILLRSQKRGLIRTLTMV